jgi:hypothetical protein
MMVVFAVKIGKRKQFPQLNACILGEKIILQDKPS